MGMRKAWNRIEIEKEKLEELYIKKGLSVHQTAKVIGCSSGPVHQSLREYGIKIRSISEAKEIFKIPKRELYNLYHKRKLSTFQIAKKYRCSHSTIVNRMKKFKIKSRGHLGLTKPIQITKDKLIYLYHKRGLSFAKIAKILHCSESGVERRFNFYGIKSRGIDNRASKHKKTNFNGSLKEKAYMIGFRLGDLNVYSPKNIVVVKCSTTKFAQVRLIRNLFSKYGGLVVSKAKRGTYEIYSYLDKSFSFLIPKEDKIPKWILENNQYFLSFFAGYADAEGSFYLKKESRGRGYPIGLFEIQTQDKKIISQSWRKLSQLGVLSPSPAISKKAGIIDKKGRKNNRDVWRLAVSRKDSLWRFIHFMKPFMRHADKLKVVENIKENIISRNKRAYCQPFDLSIPAVP